MLLSEQERILAKEQVLLNAAPLTTNFTNTTFEQIWGYGGVTVPTGGGLVFFNFSARISNVKGTVALYIGGIPVAVADINPNSQSGSFTQTLYGLVYLNAGNYAVTVWGNTTNASDQLYILGCQIGLTMFNDVAAFALQSATEASLTVPSRMTPVGPLKMAVYAINVSAVAPSGQNASIAGIDVDGVAQSFDENYTGTCLAASAVLFIPLIVGVSHTIIVSPGNSNQTTYLSIVACPWILCAASKVHQPVTLNFTQQSTLYVTVCPLFFDAPVKECYVGYPKGISFGPLADYYSYASAGTGASVSFNFTFNAVNTLYATLSADPTGCCIDNIAADVI